MALLKSQQAWMDALSQIFLAHSGVHGVVAMLHVLSMPTTQECQKLQGLEPSRSAAIKKGRFHDQ